MDRRDLLERHGLGPFLRPQKKEPERLTYYEMILARGGGLITLPDFLGVMVAPAGNEANCPAGWMFVPLEGTTPQQLKEWCDQVRDGRKLWPPAEVPSAPPPKQQGKRK